MSSPWFYSADLSSDLIALDDAEAAHAAASRRLVPGDHCTLFDGRGTIADCEIVDAAGRAAGRRRDREFRVAVRARRIVESPRAGLRLLVAAPKKDRLEWLVEKCTELGATHLTFVEYERSIVHPGGGKLDRLVRTAIEACKQSRRALLPTIDGSIGFEAAIKTGRDDSKLAVADAAGSIVLSEWISTAGHAAISVFIGPEGGLSENEIEALEARGAAKVRLGPGTLRIETAAVAATAIWAERRPG